MITCPPVADPWTVPTLEGNFTRCDIAAYANTGFDYAFVVSVVVIFLLAIIAFRGR